MVNVPGRAKEVAFTTKLTADFPRRALMNGEKVKSGGRFFRRLNRSWIRVLNETSRRDEASRADRELRFIRYHVVFVFCNEIWHLFRDQFSTVFSML